MKILNKKNKKTTKTKIDSIKGILEEEFIVLMNKISKLEKKKIKLN